MEFTNDNKSNEPVFSKKVRAGKRRTYFFDVRTTKGNDYYLTITESRKKMNDEGFERHKVFLYKEDVNKFINELTETIDYLKNELMPTYDFDQFSHAQDENYTPQHQEESEPVAAAPATPIESNTNTDDLKW